MPIDREKAGKALDELVKRGMPREEAVSHANGVERDLSFALFCVQTLGPVVGNRYVSEQFVEYLEYGAKIEFDKVSVPEVLLTELLTRQEWHKPDHVASMETFFRAEAAEPWHPSLRDKYQPVSDAAAWFNDRPYSFKLAVRILTSVYK